MADLGSAPVESAPNWQEDDNSPVSVSGQSSLTYTLASTYDKILIFRNVPDGKFGFRSMRVNGDTGTNYDYIEWDGGGTTGADAWQAEFGQQTPYILLQPIRGNGGIGMARSPSAVYSSTEVMSGDNSNVTAPIDQFTLLNKDGGTTSETIHVYGWNA